jgi:hypothetical protein
MLRAVTTLLLTVNLMTEAANAKECVLRTIINKSQFRAADMTLILFEMDTDKFRVKY